MSKLLDEQFMLQALELAAKAKGQTSPNPMVGAVIVKNGKVIAEGFHQCCGKDHAEIAALKKAKGSVKGATMYVTLEPCNHVGRTPPCVDKVIASGIKEVVIAMKDPNLLTNGKSIRKLQAAGIKVRSGILEKEAKELNEVFIKYIKEQMPFVTAKIAQTLDGKIATANRQSKWITSDKTRAFTRSERNLYDAIVVGVNTMMADDPELAPFPAKKKLKKVILDSSLRVSPQCKIFQDDNAKDCILATSSKAKETSIGLFKHKGCQVIVCPLKEGKVDWIYLLKELARQEISSILIEGGAEVMGSALKAGIVDKVQIYVAPKFFGDQRALGSVSGINISKIENAVRLTNIKINQINEDVRIEGYVFRNH